MSDNIGPVSFNPPEALGIDRPYGRKLRGQIEEEVVQMVHDTLKQAESIIQERKGDVVKVGILLIITRRTKSLLCQWP